MENISSKLDIDQILKISKEILSDLKNQNISEDEIKNILKYTLLNLDRFDSIR